MNRTRKLLAAAACGGITFGWLQAWEMVSFSNIWTELIASLLSALVALLFGADASTLLA